MDNGGSMTGAVFMGLGIVFAFLAVWRRERRLHGKQSRPKAASVATGINYDIPAFKRMEQSRSTPGAQPVQSLATVTVLSDHGATLHKQVGDKAEALRRSLDALVIEKAKIEAGLEGERAVGSFILGQLNDEWTVIEGFMGAKGEIDFVLVGPQGVFAIEVKNRSGIVSCNGDQWAITKHDGTIEQLKDNGGRSPARQLNESAGWLASKLHHAGFSVRVPTAIVLPHPKASLGAVTNMGVNYLILLGNNAQHHFKNYLALGTRLTKEQIGTVVPYVQSIHQKDKP